MSWASEEFSTIDLGDARLNSRAVLLAERIAQSPSGSIPEACQGWAEIQAAYRLFDHDRVDFWSIMEPHIACTAQRMAAQSVVLCLQDTTTLDFNGQDIEGLGPLQYEAQRGLLLHPTYVVTPQREPLGLLDSIVGSGQEKAVIKPVNGQAMFAKVSVGLKAMSGLLNWPVRYPIPGAFMLVIGSLT